VAPYWIDSGVLIQSQNGHYAMELVPKFWTFIETELKAGTIRMPKMCFEEVTDGDDDLSKWCKRRKNIGYFCCTANRDVQERLGAVSQYVYDNYPPHVAADFLKGADPWVIAHALATGGFVVTEELRNKYKSKLKIPVIAKAMHAPWKATYEMCKELGAHFS
jgi:hypothetical protein